MKHAIVIIYDKSTADTEILTEFDGYTTLQLIDIAMQQLERRLEEDK